MYVRTTTESRPDTKIAWFDRSEHFVRLFAMFAEEGRILNALEVEHDNGTRRSSTVYWRSEADYKQFEADPVIGVILGLRDQYNQTHRITTRHVSDEF